MRPPQPRFQAIRRYTGPATGSPRRTGQSQRGNESGATYREAHLLMEILGDSGRVCALDIVEINPILDDGNQTAELAVGLAASLLGQRIL